MNIRELERDVQEKSQRMEECQRKAAHHEQAARELRAEYSTLKVERADLIQQVHQAASTAATQQAMSDAAAAKQQAESAAQQLEAELQAVRNLRAQLEEQVNPAPMGE